MQLISLLHYVNEGEILLTWATEPLCDTHRPAHSWRRGAYINNLNIGRWCDLLYI